MILVARLAVARGEAFGMGVKKACERSSPPGPKWDEEPVLCIFCDLIGCEMGILICRC